MMYDILVMPGQDTDMNRKESGYYQRTVSQDRLDLLDSNYGDRTEVPSINGGLPITMQVKKEPSYTYGQQQPSRLLSSGASHSTLAVAQPKQRRPFSPPLKHSLPDKGSTGTTTNPAHLTTLDSKRNETGVDVQDQRVDQDGEPPEAAMRR